MLESRRLSHNNYRTWTLMCVTTREDDVNVSVTRREDVNLSMTTRRDELVVNNEIWSKLFIVWNPVMILMLDRYHSFKNVKIGCWPKFLEYLASKTSQLRVKNFYH